MGLISKKLEPQGKSTYLSKRKSSKKNRLIINKIKLPFIGFLAYVSLFLVVLPIQGVESQSIYTEEYNSFQIAPEHSISEVNLERINFMNKRYWVEKEVDKLHTYLLKRNRSVFANREIARIIVEESNKLGADYRIVTAIMYKESGLCAAPYKAYNCFGYLNKVQYSSFNQAFKELVPKVAKIVARFNWNTDALAQAYGPVDKQGWSLRVNAIARGI